MTREAFIQQLKSLHDSTVGLANQVEAALQEAIQAFTMRDRERARKVISNDAGINRAEAAILEEATTLLLLQAPVASDLRQIVGISRIAGGLERIGDHARDIALTTVRLASSAPIDDLIDLPALIDEVLAMVHRAIECLTQMDAELARNFGKMRDQIDRSYDALFQELLGHMLADTAVTARATYALLVGRELQEIADHVTNIAEAIIYIVTARTEELS